MNSNEAFVSGASIFRYTEKATLGPFETRKIDLPVGEVYQRDERFQAWRGHIINHSLFIEERIDLIISKLFLKKDIERVELFRAIILSREFFGFMNKWKVLKDLLTTIEPYKNNNYSSLYSNLHNLINERDKFAHGQVTYSGSKGEKIILEYFKEKLQKEEITEKNVEDFLKLSFECRKGVDEILSEIRKNE